MGLFGKLFSKRVDPELERAVQRIEQIIKDSKKPQGAYKMALSGAETRHRLLSLIEEVDTEIGQTSIIIAEDGMLIHPKLTVLLQKQADYELLELALGVAFPSPDKKRQLYEQWPSTLGKYQGQQNTEELLSEKITVLATFIIYNLDIAQDILDIAQAFYAETPTICPKLSDEQKTSIRLEEVALWYRVIEELAQKCLGQEPSCLFMDHLLDEFAHILALQGASPDEICGTMVDRINEYGQYQKWISEEGEGAAGTLLWEAGKHILEPFGCSRNFFLLITFEKFFLWREKMAFVYELLTGRNSHATS